MKVEVGLKCSRCHAPLRPLAKGWSCTGPACHRASQRAAASSCVRGPYVKALIADPFPLFN